MSKIIVSVIVPVYNTEKYLERCVNSILSQSFSDFELLLIDDGSSDASGIICDRYAQKDKRVRVFHKENAGVSSARNMGLDKARGEWIAFVDSDDFLHPHTLDVFNVDMESSIDVIEIPYKRKNQSITYSSYLSDSAIEVYYANNFRNSACLKYYKRSLIGKIRFVKNLKIGEDAVFVLSVLLQSKGIYASRLGYYFYNETPGSAMDSVLGGSIDLLEKQHDLIFHFILQNKMESHLITKGFIINEFGYCFSVASKDYLNKMIRTMSYSWYVAALFSHQIKLKKRVKLLYMILRGLCRL